jgi:hypothetical protein
MDQNKLQELLKQKFYIEMREYLDIEDKKNINRINEELKQINGGKNMFEVFIETLEEDLLTIDIVDNLEDARKIAKSVPIEKYKSISILELSSIGNIVKMWEVE